MTFAKTVKAHLSGIVNFVETHITNAILESINNKIQIIIDETASLKIPRYPLVDLPAILSPYTVYSGSVTNSIKEHC